MLQTFMPHVYFKFSPFPHVSTPCSLSRSTEMTCLSDNAQAVDQSHFWSDGSLHWDAHRIGWAIAGGFTVLVRVNISYN